MSDESEEEYEKRMREGRSAGEAKEVVADSAHRGEFLDVQSRAEPAYTAWNLRSNPPLYGERLRDYRIRLLRPLQKHSKQYAKSDLETLPRDEAVFGAIERTVFADSISASSSADSVPVGQLRPIVRRMEKGCTEVTWVGQPQAWMDRFAANRRFVVRLNSRWNTGGPTE